MENLIKYGTVIREDQREKLRLIKEKSGVASNFIIIQALDMFFAQNEKMYEATSKSKGKKTS